MTGDPRRLEVTNAVLERMVGSNIETRLLELAALGGTAIEPTAELPVRYSVNRLALSEEDFRSRNEILKPWMEEAGMTVFEHPLALIGTYRGTDPSLEPLVLLSHTDTVPKADMYDGTTGVVSAIEAVKHVNEAGLVLDRDLMVVALTGEESARFNMALFGSRSLFHGLSDSELAARREGDVSIADALGMARDELVKQPYFNESSVRPRAVLELHVEQGRELTDQDFDLGIVEVISAPTRHKIEVGNWTLLPDEKKYAYDDYFTLTVEGKADHSGTTPMGNATRADGLVETATCLYPVIEDQLDDSPSLSIGDIEIEGQAINKIPGQTITTLRIASDDAVAANAALIKLRESVEQANGRLAGTSQRFDKNPVRLEKVGRPENSRFYASAAILPRFRQAFGFITDVSQAASKISEIRPTTPVVGTVGTFNVTNSGTLEMLLDLRSTSLEARDQAFGLITHNTENGQIMIGSALPGSTEPVSMDQSLVKLADQVIREFNIGRSKHMASSAGHDVMNAAKAGWPSVLIFCPSRNEGLAHHPDAYSTSEDIEKGAKALAALALRLSID